MPRSSRLNMVALIPFLYIDVPSTMSFSSWPITFRHIRSTAFALMPVGIDLASGRWVASISSIPSAGPRFTKSVQMASSSSPCSPCSKATWHSSRAITIGCRPRRGSLDSSGVTLFSGHRVSSMPRMTFARRRSSTRSLRRSASMYSMSSGSSPDL